MGTSIRRRLVASMGGPHTAESHVCDCEAVEGHGYREEGFIGWAIATEVGEAELGGMVHEVACGIEEFDGFERALEVVDAAVELGQAGEMEAAENEVDVKIFVGLAGLKSTLAADAEGDIVKGTPEIVKGADSQTVAVNEEGLVEGGVIVEEELLADV